MEIEMPVKPPTLTLCSVTQSATTYRFAGDTYGGWALCTVNDGTGELLITSDWGDWSYRWSAHPSHLGAATLTHFISSRGYGPLLSGTLDYLANKLLGRRRAIEFSASDTRDHLRRLLVQRRWEAGKENNRRRCGGGWFAAGAPAQQPSEADARDLWDRIGSIAADCPDNETGATLFTERLMQVDDYQVICEQPWEELQHVESHEYRILVHTILPALVAACGEQVKLPRYQELDAAFHARARIDTKGDRDGETC